MTSRIHRGFHRIGVVLAVPMLLMAIGLASHEAWRQWGPSLASMAVSAQADPYAAFTPVTPASGQASVVMPTFLLKTPDGVTHEVQAPDQTAALKAIGHTPDDNGVVVHKLVPVDYDPWAAFPPVHSAKAGAGNWWSSAPVVKPAYRADYTMASLALGLSALLYAAARAVGWVLAGFLSPRA